MAGASITRLGDLLRRNKMRSSEKTHCVHGHEFTAENTLICNTGHRACRTCKRLREKGRKRPQGRTRKYMQDWAKRDPQRAVMVHKRAQVRKVFDISLEDYNARLALQQNLCALCKESFEGRGAKRLAPCLDHSHQDGSLRKFIHNRCNRAIGFFNDDPRLLRMAAEYLESFYGSV